MKQRQIEDDKKRKKFRKKNKLTDPKKRNKKVKSKLSPSQLLDTEQEEWQH
jgi:hypothetical protein